MLSLGLILSCDRAPILSQLYTTMRLHSDKIPYQPIFCNMQYLEEFIVTKVYSLRPQADHLYVMFT